MNQIQDKIKYSTPEIERIVVDNEISLQLESDSPPWGPEEVYNSKDFLNTNPIV